MGEGQGLRVVFSRRRQESHDLAGQHVAVGHYDAGPFRHSPLGHVLDQSRRVLRPKEAAAGKRGLARRPDVLGQRQPTWEPS